MIALLYLLSPASAGEGLPGPLPGAPFAPKPPQTSSLGNKIPVFLLPQRATETFEIWIVLRAGEHDDPEGREGTALLAFDLADEGSGDLDAKAFAAEARALGAEISSSVSMDTATIRLRGLLRNLEPSVELWSSVLLAPRFAEGDLAIARGRALDQLALSLREPAGLADRIVRAAEYGPHSLGRPATRESLEAVTQADLSALWSKLSPSRAAIVAGGDLSPERLLPLLERTIGAWSAQPAAEPEIVPRPAEGSSIRLADVPGAPQSAIRALLPLPGAEIPPAERAALDVGFEVLGTSFTSRINRNLREDKGWTYGARCRPVYRSGHGFLECATLVRADATADAVSEIRRELAEIVSTRPPTAKELSTSRDALLRSWPTDHETVSSQLGELAAGFRRGLPADQSARMLSALGRVDAAAVEGALRENIAPDRISWVVSGDLSKIRSSLETLSIPLSETEP